MAARLKSIHFLNYLSLADVSLELGPINVLFGPNAAGKSSLLDALLFVRDCTTLGPDAAQNRHDRSFNLLFDGADEGDSIHLKLATDRVEYELSFRYSGKRLDPFAGERLVSLDRGQLLLERHVGSSKVEFFDPRSNQPVPFEHREPARLSLRRYLHYNPTCEEADELNWIITFINCYNSRFLDLSYLKEPEGHTEFVTEVGDQGVALWSVIRTLEGRRLYDDRYATIMGYMADAFPTFGGLVIEPRPDYPVAAIDVSFLETGRRKPILASAVSDGHIRFLTLLTLLFAGERGRNSLTLFDDPETSLHPWAIAVLAKAITEATEKWGRQVILATHSPVLISQFDLDQTLTVERENGQTRITRLSEVGEIQDLLQEYAAGSLYMSESVAPQNRSR